MSAGPPDSTALTNYIDAIATSLGLSIPAEIKPGVVANVEHLWELAQPVLTFPLPDPVESAATFEP
ncbi:DUF4089 domain-containing protein [Leptolyngbya sp. KIOST-1]|uniref:DUF4089 domain-containing protein n=1 Tax=Leptolyngbya sp. KIOST-1 TaxID=1229172 RepID=UPI000567C350|nr:DUF4089 domain-containing protein [Leptolyngbya sp. KIOST-1]